MDLCSGWEDDLPFFPCVRVKNHWKLSLANPSQYPFKSAVVVGVTVRHYHGLGWIKFEPENFQIVQHGLAAEASIVEERSRLVSSSKS